MRKTRAVVAAVAALSAAAWIGSCARRGPGDQGGRPAAQERAAAAFGYPVEGEPWYFVQARLELGPLPAGLEDSAWGIGRVEADGARVRDYIVFQDGREADRNGLRASGGRLVFDLKARHVWRPGAESALRVELVEPSSARTETVGATLRAPEGRGYWDPAWPNYLSLVLAEEHGYERKGYPVMATLSVISRYFRSPDEIRVVRAERSADGGVAYREVPSQVYDIVTWNDPKVLAIEERDASTGGRVVRYHPTTTFSLAFLADLKPREKATYLVFYNNPAAAKPVYPTDLSVERGRGYGRTIRNAFYEIVLQEKSGVIHEIVERTTGIRLEHKLETNGAIHWNPDVYAPPHAWYHSSDWSDPEATEVLGPVLYSLNLKGTLPQPEGVRIGIRYRFFAASPVVLVETSTEIGRDVFVMALRNAEVVFNKEVFTKAAFKVGGRTEVLDFASSKRHPDHAAVLRPDTPWVSLFDESRGIGFATLYLDLATPNLNGGRAALQPPYIYIQHGPWYYVSRGFVYSFGSNNQTRMLPVKAGSVYYDRNAWLAFPYPKEEGLVDLLDRWWNALKNPLAVREDIETFPESPEGWVVPILTEPFEEGVKGAKGGKEVRK